MEVILPEIREKIVGYLDSPSTLSLSKVNQTFHQAIKIKVSQRDWLTECAQHNYLTILQDPVWVFNNDELLTLSCQAALFGHLEILRWKFCKDIVVFSNAAKGGHLEIVKWLSENSCPADINAYINAAEFGHIEVLEFIHLICSIYRVHEDDNRLICAAAAKGGQLETLKWLIDHGFAICNLSGTNAARYGHLDVIQWLHTIKLLHHRICNDAARYGHLEILIWLHDQGYIWNEQTCVNSAMGGQTAILKFLRENDCPWSVNVCSGAAICGKLETLKWAHENGCPWNEDSCSNAARGGHLEVLKWLRENNCPWDEHTISHGIRSLKQSRLFKRSEKPYRELLKWAIDNGCPCSDIERNYINW